jgi:hypothetical protein
VATNKVYIKFGINSDIDLDSNITVRINENVDLDSIVNVFNSYTTPSNLTVRATSEKDIDSYITVRKTVDFDLESKLSVVFTTTDSLDCSLYVVKESKKDIDSYLTVSNASTLQSSIFVTRNSNKLYCKFGLNSYRDLNSSINVALVGETYLESSLTVKSSKKIDLDSNITVRNDTVKDLKSSLIVKVSSESNLDSILNVPHRSELDSSLLCRTNGLNALSGSLLVRQEGNADLNSTLPVRVQDYSYLDSVLTAQLFGTSSINSFLTVPDTNLMYGIVEVIPIPILKHPFNPVKDAFVRYLAQRLNYGLETDLYVGTTSNDILRTYLQFDVTTLPKDLTILKAEIKLFKSPTRPESNVELLKVNDSWAEHFIAWSNQPTIGDKITDASIPQEVGYVTFDITELVISWYNGALNTGLVIKALNELDSYYQRFYSKEYDEIDKKPVLEVYTIDPNPPSFGRAGIKCTVTVGIPSKTDLPSKIEVDSNLTENNLPSTLRVLDPNDNVFLDLDSILTVRLENGENLLLGTLQVRSSGNSFINGTLSIFSLTDNIDLNSNINVLKISKISSRLTVVKTVDLNSQLTVQNVNYLDSRFRVRTKKENDLISLIDVQTPSYIEAELEVRGVEIDDLPSQLTISSDSYAQLPSTLLISPHSDITGSLLIYESDDFEIECQISVQTTIHDSDLDSFVEVQCSDFLESYITVRVSEHNDFISIIKVRKEDALELNCTLNVYFKEDLESSLEVFKIKDLNSSIDVYLYNEIESNLTVQSYSENDIGCSIIVRQYGESDLDSSLISRVKWAEFLEGSLEVYYANYLNSRLIVKARGISELDSHLKVNNNNDLQCQIEVITTSHPYCFIM